MANIIDYLAWRGDLSFEQSPCNEVDGLIFSRLAYIPFDGIVPKSFQNTTVDLRSAVLACLQRHNEQNGGIDFTAKEDVEFLTKLSQSTRFAGLTVTGFVNTLDSESEKQFAAITFIFPKRSGLFIAYRGTDSTLIGWKEDFNMSFQDSVASQRDATTYLEAASSSSWGSIYVAGHSKGGNLAVYAAAMCKWSTQRRIINVWNNDGPGFSQKIIDTDGFKRILPRVHTYLPQSSVVGMLLEHDEEYTVIESTSVGIMQHMIFSWKVMRNGFIAVQNITQASKIMDMALKDWLLNMSNSNREKIIDAIFDILYETKAQTVKELLSGKNLVTVIKAYNELDDNTKQLMSEGFTLLKKSIKKAIPLAKTNIFGTQLDVETLSHLADSEAEDSADTAFV